MQETVFPIDENNAEECLLIAGAILADNMSIKQVLSKYANKDLQTVSVNEKEFLLKQTFKFMKILLKHQQAQSPQEKPSNLPQPLTKLQTREFQIQTDELDPPKSSDSSKISELERTIKTLQAYNSTLTQEINQYKIYAERYQSQSSKIEELSREVSKLTNKIVELEPQYMMKVHKREMFLDQEVKLRMIQEIPDWQKAAIRIQAFWRGKKVRRNYLNTVRQDLENKKKIRANPESVLLAKFVRLLRNQKLSLEDCFRAADLNADKVVTCEEFTKFLSKLKLGVDALELARLIEILDQDLSGKLESQEFYETLASYRVITDTSKVKGYTGQVLSKLISKMSEKSISSEDLFRSCDLDNSGSIDPKELEKVFKGLGMLKREILVLGEIMEKDEYGNIGKAEFVRKIKADEIFKVETQKSTSAMPKNISSIISLIEASGISLSKAFDLIHFPEPGKVQISYIAGAFSKLFPAVNKEDILTLLNTIDTSRTGFVLYKDLIDFLHSYTGTSDFTENQVRQHIISSLSSQNTTIREVLISKNYPMILDISAFISFAHSAFSISEEQSISLFNFLSNFTGRVTLEDLEKFSFHSSEQQTLLSPRSKSIKVVSEINEIISSFDLKIINIFKYADSKNTGTCSANEFCSALRKLVSTVPEAEIFELGKILPPSLTMRDLEILIPEQPKKGLDEFGMTEEEVYWILLLKVAIEKMSADPRVIFYNSDLNKDNKISMEEFKNALKRCIPGAVLTYTDICLIFKAFDRNNDGQIDEREFLQRLNDCSKSVFYKNSIGKIREQQGQFEHMKASVRPRNIIDAFPIPPMPLMHLSKGKDYNAIFERFARDIPSSITTHEFMSIYKLRLSSLITANDVQRIFKLNEFEAERVFRYLDLHNKGITYCFVLCTVIDSYRYSLVNFPIPHNNQADPNSIKIIEKMLFSLHESPVFTKLKPLNAILIWENFSNLPLDPNHVYPIKASFPRPTYNYHLSSALLNVSIGLQICPIEILHTVINKQEYCVQASEYFERFSLHSTDNLDHAQFIDKIGRILEISTVEADTLFSKLNNSKDSCKMLNFFTFFDMVLSMYTKGLLQTEDFPKLPFKQEKNLNKDIFMFFSKMASFVDKPFIRYGLNLNANYSVGELSEAFKESGFSMPELETYFLCLRMNKNSKIRCYHLAAVLDSFKDVNKSTVFDFDISMIKNLFSSRTNGLSFLKAKNYQLDHTFTQSDLEQLLPGLKQANIYTLFNFIDTFGRGFIYAHQVATVIDISIKATSFYNFPFCGNTIIDPRVKSLLSSNSRHLDVYFKSAISFYRGNQVNAEDELDLRRFQVSFEYEFTDSEAELVFSSLDYTNSGKIRVYHYIACVESFCRNSSNQLISMQDSPLQSLYKLVLSIPDKISTTEYFQDLVWYSKTPKESLIRYLTNKFSLSTTTIYDIFSEFTVPEHDEFFSYQFLTIIDLYRNCVENGKIIREPTSLPFKHKSKDIQTDLILTNFASKLDSTERGSCDYFWSKGIDPTEEISVQEFFVSLPDFNSQQCGQLFKDLDFRRTGKTFLYHLLAVLETFRGKMPENYCKPVKSKKKLRNEQALPMVISPLQDALNKLGRYLAGDNPKRRALTANEVFGMMDVNSDGTVTMNEFLDCLNLLPLNLSQNQIYLLLKEADLNGDGFINYKEFTNFILDFVKKPELKLIQDSVVEKPEIREIKGLKTSLILKPDSLEDAIMNLKLYIDSNQGSYSAIELVFGKIDYMNSNTMSPEEFSLALDRLKIHFSNSQKNSLIQFADKNRNGLIPYKAFVDFLYTYNFTEIPEETLLISTEIIDYILKPSDFFTKYSETSTILNSEKAALKRCHELLQVNGKFIDTEFGPETGKYGAGCLYFKSKPPSASYPKPSALEWPDVREVIKDCRFFKDRISSNDVIQGSLGNCWFIGALSVLATRDELLRGSVQDLQVTGQIEANTVNGLFEGVYPPMFHSLSRKGLYVLKFFKEFAWRYVIIDSRIPMVRQENEYKYVFAHCSDPSEIWVPLIEKAYAKLHKCYEALNNGLIDDALVDLTGLAAERIQLQGLDPEILWKSLLEYKQSKSLLGCSIESQDYNGEIVVEGEPTGLLAKHAYGIVEVFEVKNNEALKKRHRLIRIRNPWGQREWKGKWSSGDEKLKSHLNVLKNYLEELEPDEQFDPTNPNDGTFLMSFKDWRTLYSTLFSCVDFPDHWSGLRIQGQWTKTNSGGVPPSQARKDTLLWSKNPQFSLKIRENTEIFLTLSQKDGRFTSELFPYKNSLFFICFAIMKLLPNEDSLKEFDETRIVKLSKLRLHREVHLRTVLGIGNYIIVPATKKPNQLGDFWLSLYFSCKKESVSFTYGELNSNPIAEEEEKTSTSGPTSIRALRNTLEQVLKF